MTRFIDLAVPNAAARVLSAGHDRLQIRHVHCFMFAMLVACLGCKSDLSQQLLERELRMQEDQIYQLQDELQDQSARLNRTVGENTSLRRQLGFTEGDAPTRGRGFSMPGSPSAAPRLPMMGPGAGPSQPVLAPPAIEIPAARSPTSVPAAPPAGGPTTPGAVAPPTLEGIPPLPAEPRFPGAAAPDTSRVRPVSATASAGSDASTITTAAGIIDSSGQPLSGTSEPTGELPSDRRLSHEESLAVAGQITHLVINPARTECFDGNGDGLSDGLAIVIEPRDGDERLVTAAGDVSITVFDGGGPPNSGPVARWDIPATEAIARFRRTSRNRGLHFVLRWPGQPPQGEHVRVQVSLTTFEASSFETDGTVAVRPQQRAAEAP